MPAKRIRPLPTTRMIEMLCDTKRRLLTEKGYVTDQDFDDAWRQMWAQMVSDRAWPHATEHRRHWRVAMIATRSEARAAFLDQPTAFGTLARSLITSAARMRVEITPDQLPMVILAAIRAGYLSDDGQPQPQREEMAAA